MLLFAMALYGIAEQIFFPYLMIYLDHFLKIPTLQSSMLIFFAILIGGNRLAYSFGLLADCWGQKNMALAALFAKISGLNLFSLMRSFVPLVITGIMWLSGMSAWLISTGAWSKDMVPEDKRGQFAGFAILFTAAFAMVPGPLIGGWLSSIFGIPTVIDGQAGFILTPIIFQVAGLAPLVAALPLLAMKYKKK